MAKLMSTKPCDACGGSRLNKAARHVWVGERVLPEVVELPVGEAFEYFSALELPGHRGEIAAKILKEIQDRLGFLVNVGLNYLSLSRSADTLSGGEAQRIRLASQIGAGLVGVMYVLDEPSIGLHQRDNERLLNTLTRLRDQATRSLWSSTTKTRCVQQITSLILDPAPASMVVKWSVAER